MRISEVKFPTPRYEKVLTRTTGYFEHLPGVYAIVLTGSLARSKAQEGSCIDLGIFMTQKHFKLLPSTLNSRIEAYRQLGANISYFQDKIEGGLSFKDVRVDLNFTWGIAEPCHSNSFDVVRDEYETTIGNLLVYALPIFQQGNRYTSLKRRYLPYYHNALRIIRMKATAEEFEYKLWKSQWLSERGELFAAIDTLSEARRIFLQHLFIKERKYPIDYTKWLKEQCDEVLNKPTLYEELKNVIDRTRMAEKSIVICVERLRRLFARYCYTIPSFRVQGKLHKS